MTAAHEPLYGDEPALYSYPAHLYDAALLFMPCICVFSVPRW